MPTICYTPKRFSPRTEAIIGAAQLIIQEYRDQGFALTLRQLYYQFVARELLPNTQQSYKRLGSIISDARRAGLIDWDSIEDRTRELRENAHWESPQKILETCAKQFRYDKWADQPGRLEVWIEKDALLGVIEPICRELDVPFFSCRGYTSDSEAWRAGVRLAAYIGAGQRVAILHLGDHDPSGLDMSRDIGDRLELFADTPITICRLALNMEQVEELNPPPNPAKVTDSRYERYVEQFGQESWELDALEPSYLAKLIRDAVGYARNDARWAKAVRREKKARRELAELASHWDTTSRSQP